MSADVETEPVPNNKKNRRILLHRGLIAALIAICVLVVWSIFLVMRFHSNVSAFQKQKAQLLVFDENEAGEIAVHDYGTMPGPAFIPKPFLNYHRSVTWMNWQQQPESSLEEIDALFALLPEFHKLEELYLSGFQIDQNRAVALMQIPQLKHLSIENCQLEKSTLASLLNKQYLESISLAGSTFQEDELEVLNQISTKETLKVLILSNCSITDRTAAVLSECRNLEILHLDGTQITDTGLKMLARLPHLEVLMLDHTAVTDAGVAYLTVTSKLKELSLSNTSVSDDVVDSLKQEIPALRVSDD
ncbi:leucine-rich repeat domain-containing protein [Gimesia algae]|uniref:Leucine Rich repeats (2 copies) n=1 Tax=Gimesia algae TaxID=2527971 RepID=A0A517VLV0_9PLAN|nr:hypothetical protein [Gimesia algae]QDT93945.1 Leucine Rich repeats (2 copies) [Gimesia algae]